MSIIGLDGREFILHPGFPTPVEFDSIFYPSLLHAYTASLCPSDGVRSVVRAMARWQDVDFTRYRLEQSTGPDVDEMRRLMRLRFELDDVGRAFLLATGRERLIHDDRDFFWGRGHGRGDNHYGKLLEELRASLRSQ